MVCRPGMSVRDTSQPIGAATRQQITAEVVAMIAVVSKGSRNAGSVNNVTKFCSVGLRVLSVNANTASHDIGSTISTIMNAANSQSTGLVQSMRDFRGSAAVMVMVVIVDQSTSQMSTSSRGAALAESRRMKARILQRGFHGSRRRFAPPHHEDLSSAQTLNSRA